MNILLTTLNSKFIHTALSIRYLKSYCKEEFPKIEIEEYTINQSTDYIAREIYKRSPDVIAFSCYIWNMVETLEIVEILKKASPEITIILGGPEVSYGGEEILIESDYVDYIIHGEGEATLKELLGAIKNNSDLKDIEGIIYREEAGISTNPARALIENLDSIPSPFDDDIETFKNKIAYFESSRGCPFNCQFCLSSTIKGVRFFSIERAKSDLKKLIDMGVSQVKFVDRTFNAKKGYAMEIMNFIIAQNTQGINFHFEVTAHLVDDEMLDFLKNVKPGLFQFEVGVQSTNNDTLEAIDRKSDFEKLSYVVEKIISYNNIHLHLDLIAGLPYENYESFRKSFNDVYGLNPHKLQLGFLKLLKGSELRKKSKEYGFKFVEHAPYEVIENDYISYGELSSLKYIEDMVDKYGNEGYFKNTVNYAISNCFRSAFDFYEKLAGYWETKEYHKASHSRLSLYEKLYDFVISETKADKLFIENLVRYDFLINNRTSTLPSFLRNDNQEKLKYIKHDFLQKQDNLQKYLPEEIDKPVKKILNHVYFDIFDYKIKQLVEDDNKNSDIEREEAIYLFIYKEDKSTLDISRSVDITKEV